MTVGARDDWAWVNERPEAQRPGLLAGTVPFDAAVTPADPDVGVLAEVFRGTPGTLVSDHPEGRFAARGARAVGLVADVPWDDYYGPGSPLDRLVAWRGKVLRLGADLGTMTLFHYAEYRAAVPAKRRVRRHRLVTSEEGPVVRVVECLDDADGIVDFPGPDYFEVILSEYLASGGGRRGRVGGARSELLDAATLVDYATEWMTVHLAPLSGAPR
jgi:aminoglycoside N3'-acetyltransferase